MSGLWSNKGEASLAPNPRPANWVAPTTSPWMHGELIGELAADYKLGITGPPLKPVMDRVLAQGTFTANGKPGVRYRFQGIEAGYGSPALNGFMLGAIEATQTTATLNFWLEATYGPMLGAGWGEILSGTVVPIGEIGIEYGPQGPGWIKATKELLTGMRRP